ncbi:MAG TPA: TadE/TadG family type IV pilus assembly protein [Bradyrhizobium sp.]
MGTFFRRSGGLIGRLIRDRQANAAIEFAFVVPLMLTMFFGLVEFSAAITINRKVTLVARTMSDLVSQSSVVSDNDLTNFTETGKAIMTPYGPTPLKATVSELYVDPDTLTAKVKWSKGSVPLSNDTPISIPAALKIAGTYLVYSQVEYKFTPAVGYLIDKALGLTLKDETYTRPRQSLCVLYSPQKVCPT